MADRVSAAEIALRNTIHPASAVTVAVTKTIADMTPIHAEAIKVASGNQFAVPARQQSVRHVCAVAAIIVVAAGAFYLAMEGKLTPEVVAIVVATVGALAAGPTVSEYLNAKKQ